MIKLFLYRVADTGTETIGTLVVTNGTAKRPIIWTLEDPWKNNERNVSCIPFGYYRCEPTESPKFGKTWIVNDVAGRSHILFHAGNDHTATQGCILVGSGLSFDNGPRLVNSRLAFQQFLAALEGQSSCELLIYPPKN